MKQVLAYCNYLRDVSRKIAMQADYRNILFTKSKAEATYPRRLSCLKNTEQLTKYVKNVDKNRSIFLGLSFLVGTVATKFFSAPLVIIELEAVFDENDDDKLISLNIVPETLSINYDLISELYRNSDKAETDEEENYYIKDNCINSFMKEINKLLDDEKNKKFKDEKVIECIERLFKFSEKVQNIIKDSDVPYKNLFTAQLAFDNELVPNVIKFSCEKKAKNPYSNASAEFFPNIGFLFHHSVPDELSTYVALDALINQLKNDSIDNPIVEKILSNGLELTKNFDFEIKEKTITDSLTETIPLPLSLKQKQAIKKAWENEVSYIQGPPGTGKSHTITALILSAFFMGKKVLMVSQKRPALDVISEFFEKHNLPDIIKLYHPNDRRKLKEHVELFFNEFTPCERDFTRTIDELEKEINDRISNISYWFCIYKKKLTDEHLAYEQNEDLLHYRQTMQKKYPEFFKENYSLKNVKKINKFKNFIESIKGLSKKTKLIYADKIIISKAKKHIKEYFEIDCPDQLDNFIFFCQDLYGLHNSFVKFMELNYERDFDAHREQIDDFKKKLRRVSKKYLNEKTEQLRSLSANKHYQYELSKFKTMLYFKNTSRIKEKMRNINFSSILKIFPCWVADISDLNKLFPLNSQMFDLVIVDEASQVNLAEILPVFYRGKRICVVGDHKQLNIKSTGLTFKFSKAFDEMSWETYSKEIGIDFNNARENKLVVSETSILDFLQKDSSSKSLPQTMLDEHWRSLPALAKFTNTFYDKGLRIMTDLPNKQDIICFKEHIIKGGKRNTDKVIEEEIAKIISIVKKHIKEFPEKSLGIISILSKQVKAIEDKINEEFTDEELEKHRIIVGTPEYFQGHERDVIIISLGVDKACNRSKGHYENEPRINVATSRAKEYVHLIHSGLPDNFGYWTAFSNLNNNHQISYDNIAEFDAEACESEFERKVADILMAYIKDKPHLMLSNQIDAISYRLDFVVYNKKNKKAVAIEVDGRHHYEKDGDYTEEHIKRIDILTRAGWKIINTPYHKWWNKGWIDHPISEIKRIYKEIEEKIV